MHGQRLQRALWWLLASAVAFPSFAADPFAIRGYYLTFMRMPVMGLPEWKQAIDCFAEDDANTVVLWTAGGFRSKRHPITWQYNEEHANVRQDFLRDLIDYAHTRNIKVLLGFTPFGYDGVNRLPLEYPALKAKKPDGSPVDQFGIHSWGWNLCASSPESQRLMREYVAEMLFEFYPNADGVLIESSDYSACRCPECGPRYYDHEYTFVRWLSDEIWKRNSSALVLVYPHYFTGKKVPGLDVTAARQLFDPRWGLLFTPHSAHFESNLIQQARASVYSTDAPVLGTLRRVADSARTAMQHGVNGFLPSFEAFSYVTTGPEGGEPWLRGRRMRPLGLDPMTEGRMPYAALLPRLQRFAVRNFSANPALSFQVFEQRLAQHFFGDTQATGAVADLLELHRIWTHEITWYWSSPLLDPEFFQARATRLKWPEQKLREYDRNLETLKRLASTYKAATNANAGEMGRLSQMIVDRWGGGIPSAIAEKK